MNDHLTTIRDRVATTMLDQFSAGMTPIEGITAITLCAAAMYRSVNIPTDDAIQMFAELLRSQDGSMGPRDVN